jgi:Methylamine utilisation protein MauE
MTPSSTSPGVAMLLSAQLASFLAVLLAASAIHKGLNWQRTRRVVQDFAGVPRFAASAASAAACLYELLAAGLLFMPAYRASGALLGAVIFGVYLLLIVRALAKNRREVDCGCSFGPSRHALGAFEAWRSAGLTASALLVAVCAAYGAAPVAASQAFGALALLAIYAAVDQVMGVRPMRQGAVL